MLHDPYFPVGVITFRDGIVTKEESSSDGFAPGMINPFFAFFDIFVSR
jgi:hypothetical protein